jgi:hypothetical protein
MEEAARIDQQLFRETNQSKTPSPVPAVRGPPHSDAFLDTCMCRVLSLITTQKTYAGGWGRGWQITTTA